MQKVLPVEARYGRLTVGSYSRGVWECICDCGETKHVRGSELRGGKVTSCGCWRRESARSLCQSRATHGRTNTPEYAVWRSMLARCGNPKHKSWKDYGGRGIAVCQEWQDSFETFLRDMGERPQKGLSIERRDNHAGYSPLNCFWASQKVQARNRRRIRLHLYEGEMRAVAEIAAMTGIAASTIRRRLDLGHDLATALSRDRLPPFLRRNALDNIL